MPGASCCQLLFCFMLVAVLFHTARHPDVGFYTSWWQPLAFSLTA